MKIGLLLPSVYMSSTFRKKIFAPKKLFLQLADGLVTAGHQVFVYSAEGVSTKADVISGEAYLLKHKLPSIKFREGTPETKLRLTSLFTRLEYELDLTTKAYAHGEEVGLDIMHSYHDFMAHYVSRRATFPTIYSIHDAPYPEGLMEAWRLKHFPDDQYIALSKSHKDSFGQKIKFVDVVYHGLHVGSYDFHVNKQPYLAFMGRYLREKGVVEAIEAAHETDMALHIAGDRSYHKLKYYRDKIKPLMDKGKVREVGFMDGQDKNDFLGHAKAFLFPIKWEEPFGMVMLEAMACGTPIIAFDRGSVSEIVVDGKTGYIVDPSEGVSGLVKAIKQLNSLSQIKYEQMVHQCREHVEKTFSEEQMIKGHEKAYSKVIKEYKNHHNNIIYEGSSRRI